MNDPCNCSPNLRHGRLIAKYFVQMFPPGATVVDVGFGQGLFLEEARSAGLRAIGVDRDSRLVQSATERGLEAIETDVRNLGVALNRKVDGIIASHLIEHLLVDDLVALLDDFGQALVPGGTLVLVTPNMRDLRVAVDWFWNDPTHIRPYPPAAVQQLLDPAVWRWQASGREPVALTKRAPIDFLNRLRFGSEYARGSSWYRIQRNA